MKNIVHDRRVVYFYSTEPHFHLTSNNGPTDDIFYYIYVEIIYDLLNRVQYTTLEFNSTTQSCGKIQFNGGYHFGGEVKPLALICDIINTST